MKPVAVTPGITVVTPYSTTYNNIHILNQRFNTIFFSKGNPYYTPKIYHNSYERYQFDKDLCEYTDTMKKLINQLKQKTEKQAYS